MSTAMNPKRKPQQLWKWTERLHIPVPLALKAEVLGVARENHVSVSAFGFAVVSAALRNPAWLAQAMELLRAREEAAEQTGSPLPWSSKTT